MLANYIPEMSILDQAFLWDSQDQANYAVRKMSYDLIQEKANAQGIHVIGYMESGFRDVFSKKPIQTMADFNGVKIRTMQNDGQLLAFTSFGANPGFPTRRPAHRPQQQNTIDAYEWLCPTVVISSERPVSLCHQDPSLLRLHPPVHER